MSDETEPVDRELHQLTTNPRVAEATRAALAKLRQGVAGPELAEMATEVLEGRTDLRTIGRSAVYAAQFTDAAEKFRAWHDALSPEERAAAERDAHERLNDHDDD